jgi:hypothetical protein
MHVEEVGQAALSGWRKHVADAVARRAPMRDEVVLTVLGLLFLGLSVRHLVHTARELTAHS